MTAPQHDPLAAYVSVKEAAEILGYDPGSVRKILERTPDKLDARKWGREWMITRASVEDYKRRRQQQAEDESCTRHSAR